MKLSLKLFAALAFLLVAQVGLMAQASKKGGDPAQRAEKRAAHLTEKLGLNEAQSDKVQAILLSTGEKVKAVRDANRNDREAAKAELKAIRDAHQSAMQSVLTEEQFAQYQEIAKKRKEKAKQRRQGKRGE